MDLRCKLRLSRVRQQGAACRRETEAPSALRFARRYSFLASLLFTAGQALLILRRQLPLPFCPLLASSTTGLAANADCRCDLACSSANFLGSSREHALA